MATENTSQWKNWGRKKWTLFALVALVLVVLLSTLPSLLNLLQARLPAAKATVIITSPTKRLGRSYTLTAVTGQPDPSLHQVQARFLSYTTPTQVKEIQGPPAATYAQGRLTISGTSNDETLPGGTTFTTTSGVQLVTLQDVSIPAGERVTVPARAVLPGSAGNIVAFDLNASFAWDSDGNSVGQVLLCIILFFICIFDPGAFLSSGGDSATVQNTTPFTGGRNIYLRQDDIDTATQPVIASLIPDAQGMLEEQVHANEHLVAAPTCLSNVMPPQLPSASLTSLCVSVSVTCQAEVYDQLVAQSMVVQFFEQDARAQLGAHYVLRGAVLATITKITISPIDGRTATLLVQVNGVWGYQLSDQQKQQFVQLIAGKTQNEAIHLLLQQEGVIRVVIQTEGGWGNALPMALANITIAEDAFRHEFSSYDCKATPLNCTAQLHSLVL